ncbi:hypothetical protein FNW02_33930 [Komarekiella sp. 'clone 1']|uniref:Uncharacterized protein n=1 Tax=Komarekiella delphini-convector SJRDD-AB1 TaxID=2593771 RepID=A0AA40VUW0_9NOST|nr:hypothetical protein [Komarekiella delphini-convector]MBD6620637.1 hypothetical protein [Komarekiella delphini-convector SJRDD-AB1]
MKNDKCPIQEGVEVRLSGVVSVPHTPPLNSDALEKWIISSFKETRFKNVLQRARMLPQTSWFWHRENNTQLSELAIAIVSATINDYIQILTKRYQLAQAVQELDPKSELLLLIAPDTTYVFGTVLSTLESFSTHILFTHKKQEKALWTGKRDEESPAFPFAFNPLPSKALSAHHQANDLALYSNPNNRRY